MWALAPMAVWLHRGLGVFSAATVKHDNVEKGLSQVNGRREVGWRNGARAALRSVGAVVNPQGWPTRPKPMPRPPAVAAYTHREQARFIDAAALSGFENPEGRRWIVGASIGAGLNGPELTAAEIGDLRDIGRGRLAVQVRGRSTRGWCPSEAAAPTSCARP